MTIQRHHARHLSASCIKSHTTIAPFAIASAPSVLERDTPSHSLFLPNLHSHTTQAIMSNFEHVHGSVDVLLLHGQGQTTPSHNIMARINSDASGTLQLEITESMRTFMTAVGKISLMPEPFASATEKARDTKQTLITETQAVDSSRLGSPAILTQEASTKWKTQVEKRLGETYQSLFSQTDANGPTSLRANQPTAWGWHVFVGDECDKWPSPRVSKTQVMSGRTWLLRKKPPKYPGHVEYSVSDSQIIAPNPSDNDAVVSEVPA